MQVLDFAQSFAPDLSCLSLAEAGPLTSIVSLPFDPIKLVWLVAWVYLCLYFVQRVQFSPLVPEKYKPIANIVTLFAGPLLLLILVIVDTVKKSAEGKGALFEITKHQIQKALANRRSAKPVSQGDSTISLLNSSGSELKEIYGHGDNKGRAKHILFLTEQIIANALEQRASDILIDPKDDGTYTVRLRIDGLLRTVSQLKADTCRAIVNSIKAVSSMDISEKRRPQDGAFIAKRGGETASFRVASAGVLNGEKLSIRVLNKDAGVLTLADVGLTKKQHAVVEGAINKPSGMILICGPTGSGKTTTMYAMLNQIDRLTRNVITVEDPIEAVLPEASQIEVNPKANITFANALRSILRQDPDVICVGEIRDEETAEIALRASQTGHLVLATMHCDSNATALVRLLDLGVSPLLLSSGLSLLFSQRLLRRLCKHCRRRARLSQSLVQELRNKGLGHKHIFDAAGCEHCSRTGYCERTAICDLLVITDQIKNNIANNKTLVTELRTEGNKKDRANLRWEGLKKAASGITSLEEIKRVVG